MIRRAYCILTCCLCVALLVPLLRPGTPPAAPVRTSAMPPASAPAHPPPSVLRLYDVRDLIRAEADFSRHLEAASIIILTPEQRAQLASGGPPAAAVPPMLQEPRDIRRTQQLAQLVGDVIRRQNSSPWDDHSGIHVHSYAGRLIIDESLQTHARVARYLDSLRRDSLPQSGQPSSGQ